jgi:hypothetical protein
MVTATKKPNSACKYPVLVSHVHTEEPSGGHSLQSFYRQYNVNQKYSFFLALQLIKWVMCLWCLCTLKTHSVPVSYNLFPGLILLCRIRRAIRILRTPSVDDSCFQFCIEYRYVALIFPISVGICLVRLGCYFRFICHSKEFADWDRQWEILFVSVRDLRFILDVI